MIIYIDSDFMCHSDNAEGRRIFDVPFFNNKCKRMVEGYRYIPNDESWVMGDGKVLRGELISPAVSYNSLEPYQEQYVEDCDNMMSLSDVADIVELVYEDDLGIIG